MNAPTENCIWCGKSHEIPHGGYTRNSFNPEIIYCDNDSECEDAHLDACTGLEGGF